MRTRNELIMPSSLFFNASLLLIVSRNEIKVTTISSLHCDTPFTNAHSFVYFLEGSFFSWITNSKKPISSLKTCTCSSIMPCMTAACNSALTAFPWSSLIALVSGSSPCRWFNFLVSTVPCICYSSISIGIYRARYTYQVWIFTIKMFNQLLIRLVQDIC